MSLDGIPGNLGVEVIVSMHEVTAHAIDCMPVDLGMVLVIFI